MLNKIIQYNWKYHMIKENDKIVAGVSGGADSVCLLYILRELQETIPFSLYIVHVEHGLRGQESIEDSLFVKDICEKEGLPFTLFSCHLSKEAEKRKCSLEEAGRILRYEAFEQVLKKEGANKIAVAHNSNDRGETMLFNLFRGSGLKGLSGIPPVRDHIIRPLLCVSREEIEKYLLEKGMSFRSDYTNYENTYTRNKIRNTIIPYVEREVQSKVLEHLNEVCQIAEETEQYLSKEADRAFSVCTVRKDDQIEINLTSFQSFENIIQTYVIRLCIEQLAGRLKDIGKIHIHDIIGLSDKAVGKKISLPYRLEAQRGYDSLIVKIKKENEDEDRENRKDVYIRTDIAGVYPIDSKSCLKVSIEDKDNGKIIEEKKYTKWFDYDKINGYLLLRHRMSGDFLCVNAKLDRQMLKSYLINEKIPRSERDRLLLLTAGKHVLWIIGYRISEAYKVTKETKRIIKIQYYEGVDHE